MSNSANSSKINDDECNVNEEKNSPNDNIDIDKGDDNGSNKKGDSLLNSIVEAVMRGDMNQVVTLALAHKTGNDKGDNSLVDKALSSALGENSLIMKNASQLLNSSKNGNDNYLSETSNSKIRLNSSQEPCEQDVTLVENEEINIASSTIDSYFSSKFQNSNSEISCTELGDLANDNTSNIDNNSNNKIQIQTNSMVLSDNSSIQNHIHHQQQQQQIQQQQSMSVQLPGIGNFLVQIPPNWKPGEPITVPLNVPISNVSQSSVVNPIAINMNTGQLLSNQMMSVFNPSNITGTSVSSTSVANTGKKMRAIAPKPSKPPYRQPLIAPKTSSPNESTANADSVSVVSSTPLPLPSGPGRRKGSKGKKPGRKKLNQRINRNPSYASSTHSLDSQETIQYNEVSSLKGNKTNSNNTYQCNYFVNTSNNNDSSDYVGNNSGYSEGNHSNNLVVEQSDSGEKDLLSLAWEISNAELGNNDDFNNAYHLYDANAITAESFVSSEILDQILQNIQKDDVIEYSRDSTTNLDSRTNYASSFTTLPPCSTVLPSTSTSTSNNNNNNNSNNSNMELSNCIEIAEVVNLNTEDMLRELEKDENSLLDKFVAQYGSMNESGIISTSSINDSQPTSSSTINSQSVLHKSVEDGNEQDDNNEQDVNNEQDDNNDMNNDIINSNKSTSSPNNEVDEELSEIAKNVERSCSETSLQSKIPITSSNLTSSETSTNLCVIQSNSALNLIYSSSSDTNSTSIITDQQLRNLIPVGMDGCKLSQEASIYIANSALKSRTLDDFGLFELYSEEDVPIRIKSSTSNEVAIYQNGNGIVTEDDDDNKYIEPPILEDVSDASPIPSESESEIDEDIDMHAFQFSSIKPYVDKTFIQNNANRNYLKNGFQNLIDDLPNLSNFLTQTSHSTCDRDWHMHGSRIQLSDSYDPFNDKTVLTEYNIKENKNIQPLETTQIVPEPINTIESFKNGSLELQCRINRDNFKNQLMLHDRSTNKDSKLRVSRLRKPPKKLAIYQSINIVEKDFKPDSAPIDNISNINSNNNNNHIKEFRRYTRSKGKVTKTFDSFYDSLNKRHKIANKISSNSRNSSLESTFDINKSNSRGSGRSDGNTNISLTKSDRGRPRKFQTNNNSNQQIMIRNRRPIRNNEKNVHETRNKSTNHKIKMNKKLFNCSLLTLTNRWEKIHDTFKVYRDQIDFINRIDNPIVKATVKCNSFSTCTIVKQDLLNFDNVNKKSYPVRKINRKLRILSGLELSNEVKYAENEETVDFIESINFIMPCYSQASVNKIDQLNSCERNVSKLMLENPTIESLKSLPIDDLSDNEDIDIIDPPLIIVENVDLEVKKVVNQSNECVQENNCINEKVEYKSQEASHPILEENSESMYEKVDSNLDLSSMNSPEVNVSTPYENNKDNESVDLQITNNEDHNSVNLDSTDNDYINVCDVEVSDLPSEYSVIVNEEKGASNDDKKLISQENSNELKNNIKIIDKIKIVNKKSKVSLNPKQNNLERVILRNKSIRRSYSLRNRSISVGVDVNNAGSARRFGLRKRDYVIKEQKVRKLRSKSTTIQNNIEDNIEVNLNPICFVEKLPESDINVLINCNKEICDNNSTDFYESNNIINKTFDLKALKSKLKLKINYHKMYQKLLKRWRTFKPIKIMNYQNLLRTKLLYNSNDLESKDESECFSNYDGGTYENEADNCLDVIEKGMAQMNFEMKESEIESDNESIEVDDDVNDNFERYVDSNNIETFSRNYGSFSLKIKMHKDPDAVPTEELMKKRKRLCKRQKRRKHHKNKEDYKSDLNYSTGVEQDNVSESEFIYPVKKRKFRKRRHSIEDKVSVSENDYPPELTAASPNECNEEKHKPIKIKLFKSANGNFSNSNKDSENFTFSIKPNNIHEENNMRTITPKMLNIESEIPSKPCREAANVAKKKIFSTAKEDRRSQNATLSSIWNSRKPNLSNKYSTDVSTMQLDRSKRPRGRPPKSRPLFLSDKFNNTSGTLKLKIKLSKDYNNCATNDNYSSNGENSGRTSTNDSSILNSAVAGINGPSDILSMDSNNFINGISAQMVQDNMEYMEANDAQVYFNPHRVDIEKIKNTYFSNKKILDLNFKGSHQENLEYSNVIKSLIKEDNYSNCNQSSISNVSSNSKNQSDYSNKNPVTPNSHYGSGEKDQPSNTSITNLQKDTPKSIENGYNLSSNSRKPQDLSNNNQGFNFEQALNSPKRQNDNIRNECDSSWFYDNHNLRDQPYSTSNNNVYESYMNSKDKNESNEQLPTYLSKETEAPPKSRCNNEENSKSVNTGRPLTGSEGSPHYSRGSLGPIPPQLNIQPWSDDSTNHGASLNHTAAAWMTYAQHQAAAAAYMDPQMKAYYNLALSQSMLNNSYCGTYGNGSNPDNFYSSLHSQYLNNSKEINDKASNTNNRNQNDPMGSFMEATQMSPWEQFYSAAAMAGYHNASQGNVDDYAGRAGNMLQAHHMFTSYPNSMFNRDHFLESNKPPLAHQNQSGTASPIKPVGSNATSNSSNVYPHVQMPYSHFNGTPVGFF